MRPWLILAFVAFAVLLPVTVAVAQTAQPSAGPFTVWMPVIVAIVPVVVMFAKKVIPDNLRALVPVVALVVGPILDFLISWLVGKAADPAAGVIYGSLGVVLREVVDQAKKAWGSEA